MEKTIDKFQAELDPTRKNGWRIVRVDADGTRNPLSQRFTKEHTAKRHAYKLQVAFERRFNRTIYVGD